MNSSSGLMASDQISMSAVKPLLQHSEVNIFTFDEIQANELESAAIDIARLGGPQVQGAKTKAAYYATAIAMTFTEQQFSATRRFANGELSLLIFEGLHDPGTSDAPLVELPELSELENDFHCRRLASRSQILLQMVSHSAFAYDLDNNGQLVRLVGNFKGGGKTKLAGEYTSGAAELSSHSGLALGAHTEAPYYCSVKYSGSHSPAPSSLILTARWNPQCEPTTVIPMHDIIAKIGSHNALALTAKVFKFSRSDSFVSGKGEDGRDVSILDIDDQGAFAIRYNAYRFCVNEDAPLSVKSAFQCLNNEIEQSKMVQYAPQPSNAIVINNCRALHCRDEIKDNRRLLVRLFGYSRDAEGIILSEDPLLMQG
ncbi:hypothetical protein RGU70_04215 [Herbaspirillum sp. RTI4]|uniref:hypothetical protein n=1 Tax=Herbaspirillum sp. RTI4 TaxID=3048640 RepID=UPI002AB370AF|nr:hypothetical protein [Herbaspirillum sp. RTI4]MDY7577524.1 hypothetical protein [Herbaspirillum sp. RTI4]MEA9980999.1 hypothetical protein [Herbaspirillum sp. RTI4]